MLLTILAVAALSIGVVESKQDIETLAFEAFDQNTVVQTQAPATPQEKLFLDI